MVLLQPFAGEVIARFIRIVLQAHESAAQAINILPRTLSENGKSTFGE